MNGVFITLEGTEGAGKTTQVRLLADWLVELGLCPVVTREPGAGKIGAQIRNILLNPENEGLSPLTEALLMVADRAQHTAELLQPKLAEGRIVLCDRYIDSHIAYQGYGRGLSAEWLRELNERATEGLYPDLTLLLDLPPKVGLERAMKRGAADRMEQEQAEFHQRIYDGYHKLAAAAPERIRLINAAAEIDKVQADIRREVWALLVRKGMVENAVR